MVKNPASLQIKTKMSQSRTSAKLLWPRDADAESTALCGGNGKKAKASAVSTVSTRTQHPLETAVSEEKKKNQTSMLERKNQNCPYLPHMRSYV